MRITSDILQKQWDGIGYKDGGFLQIDIEHPLEWYIGFQSISQKTLLLVSNADIKAVDSSKSMAVTRRRRESDNRWTLSFELMRNEQEDVFSILCADIIEHSRTAINEEDALKLVISRYKQWSRLLESQKSGLMDEKSRKGLLGELLFLQMCIGKGDAVVTAVQGWAGAEGADQDFMYEDRWYEIKSVGASAASVKISSLEQLDCEGKGHLVVMRIDKSVPDRTGALSLNEQVRKINMSLAGSSEASDLFNTKLSAYGYMDLREYSEQKYYCSGMQYYIVNDTFPKITRKDVPSQVEALSYELSLLSMADWMKG